MENIPPQQMRQLLQVQEEQIRRLQLELAQVREIGEMGNPQQQAQQQAVSAETETLQQWVAEEWDNLSGGGEQPEEAAQEAEQGSASAETATGSEMTKVSVQQHTAHTLQTVPIEGRAMLRVETVEAELLGNVQPGVGGSTVPATVGISGNFQPAGDFDVRSEISQHGSSTGSSPMAALFGRTPGSEISPEHTSGARSQDSSAAGSASGGAAEEHGGGELTFPGPSVSPPVLCAFSRQSVTLPSPQGGTLAKIRQSVTSSVTFSPEHGNGAFSTPQQAPAGQGVAGVQPEDCAAM